MTSAGASGVGDDGASGRGTETGGDTGGPPPPTDPASFYGEGYIQARDNNNPLRFQGVLDRNDSTAPFRAGSYHWVQPWDADASHTIFYLRTADGYAGGDRGYLMMDIVPDDGSGLPLLTSQLYTTLPNNGSGEDGATWSGNITNGALLQMDFIKQVDDETPLHAGQTYHLVWYAAQPTPDYDSWGNHASINGSFIRSPKPDDFPPQFEGWGHLFHDYDQASGAYAWINKGVDDGGGEIYATWYSGVLYFADGSMIGDPASDSAKGRALIGGHYRLRQRFVPQVTRTVTTLRPRFWRYGTPSVPLVFELSGPNGSRTISYDPSELPETTIPGNVGMPAKTFESLELQEGETYVLEVSAEALDLPAGANLANDGGGNYGGAYGPWLSAAGSPIAAYYDTYTSPDGTNGMPATNRWFGYHAEWSEDGGSSWSGIAAIAGWQLSDPEPGYWTQHRNDEWMVCGIQ